MRASLTLVSRVTLSARAVLLAIAVVLASLGLPALAGAEPPSGSAEDVVPDRIVVKWEDGTPESARAEGRAAAGAEKIKEIQQLGVDVLRVPEHAAERALERLQRNAHVQYAESDTAVAIAETLPNDEFWDWQWGPAHIGTPQAWDVTTGASSVVIAVLDTGVTSQLPDLQSHLVAGRNIITGTSDTEDDHGHGTRVAGVAAAVSNNVSGIAGVCWNCGVMPVKVMSASGTGYMSDVAAGITWATDHGAKVVNMSLAGSSGTSTLASAVQYAHDRGILLFGAAGNEGTTTPQYPAAYADVVGVAATASDDTLSSYSNRGSWVDVAAPGANMATSTTGSYSEFIGTSSATPVVAGVAGLALATGSTASQVRDAMRSSAVPIDGVAYGRVDAYGTVGAASAAPAPTPAEDPSEPAAPSDTTTVTTVFTGTFNRKTTSHTFSVGVGDGDLTAALEFTKAKSLSLVVNDANGSEVASASGASVLQLATPVARGDHTLTVSGANRGSFTLTITSPAP